jgi:diacylglycerol kinase family enzyme
MKIAVIINSSAGPSSANESLKIEKSFRQKNVNIKMFEAEGDNISEIVSSALKSDADVIVAAGGDGTINSVINSITDKDIPFGIIPIGTLNHLAKDADIPIGINEAAEVIIHKNIKMTDLAEVNGHYFVNNSSVGIYPKIVLQRENDMERLGYGKWFSMLRAVINVFWNYRILNLRIVSDETRTEIKTPFIFIGNNKYFFDLFNFGKRKEINNGVLSLYYPKTTGRWSMLRFALLALFNRINQEKDFVNTYTREIQIHSKKRKLHVSVDGEVISLTPPLEYRIHKGKLKLIVPGDK